jgi:hypothetical protein
LFDDVAVTSGRLSELPRRNQSHVGLRSKIPSRPGKIRDNPANRLVETGTPKKKGFGWRKKWLRMTRADEQAYNEAVRKHYKKVVKVKETAKLPERVRQRERLRRMAEFRKNWLKRFLKKRKY